VERKSARRPCPLRKRSPDTASLDDIRRFQLHLAETDVSICTRNRIMTGLRFLFRETLRRLDLAEEVYHLGEPQKLPLVMSIEEMKRLLVVTGNLKTRVLLSLGYGCGLRASEVVRLRVKHIDRAQKIIRIEQSKGRKDRNVMLPDEMLGLLRQWWKARPSRHDAGIPLPERWLFPSRKSAGRPITTRHLNRLFHEAADAAGEGAQCLRHLWCGRPMMPSTTPLALRSRTSPITSHLETMATQPTSRCVVRVVV
jgi:integrase/recombinase XerD